jgi:pyrimidine-specific ribonucleoside hydrolase
MIRKRKPEMPIPVIMDCDPGHDDAIALLLALASPELEVKAITIVGGNQTLEKTTLNALKILELAGANVPVAPGAAHPLVRRLETAPQVHGESGLDGPSFPVPQLKPSPLKAIDMMAKVIRDSEVPVTLIPTAPLSNVALFLSVYPELKSKIERIVMMGGAAVGGNWSPAAEFNILVDPEAARIVFTSGIPLVMCGLDVTHKAQIYPEEVEILRTQGNKVSRVVAELIDYFKGFHVQFGFRGSPLHDPVAVAYCLKPELFQSASYHVDIELGGDYSAGATIVDWFHRSGKPQNAQVVLDINREGFIRLLRDRLMRYSD